MPVRSVNDEGREVWDGVEFAIAGMTHVGRTRKVNQDAFDRFDAEERGEILLVVADGLGGHRGGEVASKMAVGTLGKMTEASEGNPDSQQAAGAQLAAGARLTASIERANEAIFKLASKDRTLKGMGTTVVALLLSTTGQSYVAHVGDSRLYLSRDGLIRPVTEDHSVVALLLRDGAITPEEARDHPKRNQILRALGVRDDVEIEVAPIDLEAGDSVILCSDGLYGMLPDDDLNALLQRAPDPHTAVAWMIDAANQAGGTDNITAMVATIYSKAASDDTSGASSSPSSASASVNVTAE